MLHITASIRRVKLSRRWWLVIVASMAMWLIVIIPSGIGIFALLVFTAPAAALGVFLRWASCLFTPWRWNWRMATNAAAASAMLLPPLLAALVAVSGLQRPEVLLPLFVLGAWVALAVGLLAAAVQSATAARYLRRTAHIGRTGQGRRAVERLREPLRSPSPPQGASLGAERSTRSSSASSPYRSG